MSITIRDLLLGILAAGVAPAFVGAGVLMLVRTVQVVTKADLLRRSKFDPEEWSGRLVNKIYRQTVFGPVYDIF